MLSYADRQKNTEINGRDYGLLTFGAEKSWNIVNQLTSMIGDGAGLDISSMAIKLLGHKEGLKLIKSLLSELQFEGKNIDFDNHFATYRKDLLPAVGFSLSENVVPFFDPDSLQAIAVMIEKAMSGSDQ